MSTLVLPTRRRRALALTAALVGGLLATLPATPASAAPTGTVTSGTAAWGISTYLNSTNPGRPNPYPTAYVAPATFDSTSRISTWGGATGLVAGNGSAELQLAGTSVNYAPTSGAWLKLADLRTTLDTSGNGTVSALVSYRTAPGTMSEPGDPTYNDAIVTRGPLRMDIVTLAGNTAADRTSTPTQTTWTGLDGTWTAAFLDFMDGDPATSTPAWTYAINSTTDRSPRPFTFTVATTVPDADAVVTDANYGDGVTIGVTGTGFRAVTNPGDAGIYAGLAPSGGLPDVSTPGGQAAFAASTYITPGQIVDGSFAKNLVAPTAGLDKTKTYSVYTWQAHTYSNTTQNTETPVTINWTALEPLASTTTPSGASSKAYGATSTLTAAVPGKGSVTLTGVGPVQTKPVSAGAVSFTVPASLAVGSYTASFAYSGGGAYLPSSSTMSLAVTKATPTLGGTWQKKPTTKKRGRLNIVAAGPAGATAPTGDVVIKVSRQGESSSFVVTLVDGKAVLKLPKLAAGTWKLKLTYLGGPSYDGAKAKLKVVV